MKTSAKLLAVMFLVCITSLYAYAVSWSPEAAEREEKAAKGIREKGEAVCLFQSGTREVRKEIHTGDVLSVYREDRNHQPQKVGTIRVLSYVGMDYLKGEVVEGELMPGDVAKKGEVAGLVISSEEKCRGKNE